ncbi:enoyl-CoA hydratase/isomerase family protein [Verticiella sediminum]|uniref:Enoyl-CoA hydratase/isomerase family protein n=1 Tax=Verticiella sediminum TaxID=1247510 RepID=A0A556AJ25_9BURK|nr:enoyl-CoA hydratase/isomerase family protein [Verticiella sediminum]TSH92908.1 enoyl-CoA hydratase/isomerase family protein [Verticiella sediminum]
MADKLVTTQQDESVLIIRLTNPKSRNSLTMEMRRQLGEAVELAAGDTTVRTVLVTGEGPTFCSGGDLHHLQMACDPWPVHRRFRNLSQWLTPLITLDKPVVVGVNGHAVGGGMGLALTGDVIVAGQSAQFVSGFFKLGAIPDIAVMYHLPRLIGMSNTKKLLFSGGSLSAAQAADLGLVAKVVPDGELHEASLSEAKRLAQGPAEVMGLAKTIMARTFETSLHDMLAFEGFGQALAMSNPEFREGLEAALARRSADFQGAALAAAHSTQGAGK